MKKLRTFALYALVTPAITLGAGSVLAQQSTGADSTRQHQSTQRDQDATLVNPGSADSDRSIQRGDDATRSTRGSADNNYGAQPDENNTRSNTGLTQSERGSMSDAHKTADRNGMSNRSSTENRSHIASVPAQGMRANDLMGAKVSTAADKDVGPINDLVIDKDGQVVAIVVSVGGFLGMGEKDVAIGWDNVTVSDTTDDLKLKVDVTREDLSSAPEFKKQD